MFSFVSDLVDSFTNVNEMRVVKKITFIIVLINLSISLMMLVGNIPYQYVLLYLGIVFAFYMIILVGIQIINYRETEIFKIKQSQRARQKEMSQAKKQLELATESCVNDFEKMKKTTQYFDDNDLNKLLDDYRNKLMIVVKQKDEYLKEVTTLKKIVLEGYQLTKSSNDVLSDNTHLIELYTNKLKQHLETKIEDISEVLKTIQDNEQLKLKELNNQYINDINKLFS